MNVANMNERYTLGVVVGFVVKKVNITIIIIIIYRNVSTVYCANKIPVFYVKKFQSIIKEAASVQDIGKRYQKKTHF